MFLNVHGALSEQTAQTVWVYDSNGIVPDAKYCMRQIEEFFVSLALARPVLAKQVKTTTILRRNACESSIQWTIVADVRLQQEHIQIGGALIEITVNAFQWNWIQM